MQNFKRTILEKNADLLAVEYQLSQAPAKNKTKCAKII